MVSKKANNTDSNSSLLLLVIYVLSSFFGGLLFSLLALRAKKRGKVYFWWLVLALMFIGVFSYISYLFYISSSPIYDQGYYYLGISTLISNGIALLILIITMLLKK